MKLLITIFIPILFIQVVYGQKSITEFPKYAGKATLFKTSNNSALQKICKRISEDFRRVISRDKAGGVKSALGNINVYSDKLLCKLSLANYSNVSFEIDFIRFYLADLKKIKRTVTQEQELKPVYSYNNEFDRINGNGTQTYVFVLDKFPISKDRALFIEVYEKNGSRHQYLKASYAAVYNAQSIH